MKRIECSVAFIMLTFSAAQAKDLTGEQLQEALVGKQLSFTGKAGSGNTVYSPDGGAKIMFNGKPDKGKWRIKGSSMCVTWTQIRKGEEGCFTAAAEGGNKFKTSNGFTVTAQ